MTESEAATGGFIPNFAVYATIVFALVQVVADVVPRSAALAVAVAVSGTLFVVGLVAFGWGFVVAAGRSREETLTLSGLYLLQGTAPESVRRRLLGALAAQILIAVVTAAVRPFTPLAFGILVPMLGVGLTGLWAARHGSFGAAPSARSTAARGSRTGAPVTSPAEVVDEDPDDFDQLFKRRPRRQR